MCRKIVLAIKFWFKVDYCLCIVLSNTYWIVFLFCCSSSCTPYVVNCSGLFNFDCPFGILQRFFPYVKGYRSFFTELIYYTYDICHDYYLYDMHRDQDWESRVLYNNASVLLTRGKRLHGCFSSLRDECFGPRILVQPHLCLLKCLYQSREVSCDVSEGYWFCLYDFSLGCWTCSDNVCSMFYISSYFRKIINICFIDIICIVVA